MLWADVDPLTGGAGWAGAGLLGLVLAWLLLKHLPTKDAQFESLSRTKDEQILALMNRNDERLQQLATTFRQESREDKEEFKRALDAILAHCEREMSKVGDAMRAELRTVAGTRQQHE